MHGYTSTIELNISYVPKNYDNATTYELKGGNESWMSLLHSGPSFGKLLQSELMLGKMNFNADKFWNLTLYSLQILTVLLLYQKYLIAAFLSISIST